jgi:demethylmenaquinone methyltransferase/2-methoxy-6-polyprenyl-1,4-benzoquinol methylase
MAALPNKNSGQSKKVQVEEMFNHISPKYDLLNHLLSANIDKLWRKKAINLLIPWQPEFILDVATGTADFAIAATAINGARVVGIDISEGMLGVGRIKVLKKGLAEKIELIKADSEKLPFENDTFDAAIVGFGVRNFENLKTGLAEIKRVLKPGGVFYILEFSKPVNSPYKQIYQLYFTKILPLIGRMVSKDSNAYTYLPESVNEFPDGEKFLTILAEVGFVESKYFLQTFGIASIYEAQKPKNEPCYTIN